MSLSRFRGSRSAGGLLTLGVAQAALWGMLALSAIACVLLVLNAYCRRLRPLVVGSAGFVGNYMLAVLLIPATFEKFIVARSGAS